MPKRGWLNARKLRKTVRLWQIGNPRCCDLDRSAAPAQADEVRVAHSSNGTWEWIRARLRTLDSSTPAQMDIYFTLLSLFFFTKPGNDRPFANLRKHYYFFFCCAWTILRTKRPLMHFLFWLQIYFDANRRVNFENKEDVKAELVQ